MNSGPVKRRASKRPPRRAKPLGPPGWPYRNPATFWMLAAGVLVAGVFCAGAIASLGSAFDSGWLGVVTGLTLVFGPVALVTRPFAHRYWHVDDTELRSMLPARAGARLLRRFTNSGFVALRKRWPIVCATHSSGTRLLLPWQLRGHDGCYRFRLARGRLYLVRDGD